jgi:hypothetical protein
MIPGPSRIGALVVALPRKPSSAKLGRTMIEDPVTPPNPNPLGDQQGDKDDRNQPTLNEQAGKGSEQRSEQNSAQGGGSRGSFGHDLDQISMRLRNQFLDIGFHGVVIFRTFLLPGRLRLQVLAVAGELFFIEDS